MSTNDALWSQLAAYCESVTPANTRQRRPDQAHYVSYKVRFDRSIVTVTASQWSDYLPYFVASLGLPTKEEEAGATKQMEEMRRMTESGECTHSMFAGTARQGDDEERHIECAVFLLRAPAEAVGQSEEEVKYRLAYL